MIIYEQEYIAAKIILNKEKLAKYYFCPRGHNVAIAAVARVELPRHIRGSGHLVVLSWIESVAIDARSDLPVHTTAVRAGNDDRIGGLERTDLSLSRASCHHQHEGDGGETLMDLCLICFKGTNIPTTDVFYKR